MEAFEADGLWWDAERPARASAGILRFNRDAVSELHLIGGWLDDEPTIRTSFDPAALTDEQRREMTDFQSIPPDLVEQHEPDPDGFPLDVRIAHGVVDGAKVTLFGLTESHRNDGSVPGITTQTFVVPYVIRGDWIERDALIQHCQFAVEHLDEWCAWSGIMRPSHGDGAVEVGTCTLPRGETLRLAVGSSRSFGVFEERATLHVRFSASFVDAKTIDEVLNDIVDPTKGLVTACVGRPCRLASLEVSSSSYTWDNHPTLLEVGLSDQPRVQSTSRLHPNEILVRATDFDFAVVVPRWFELCDSRAVAMHLLWSDRFGGIEYPEMRIQTVASAAEALHAARAPGLRMSIPVEVVAEALRTTLPADQMELVERRLEHLNEPTLRERVRHLFDLVAPVLPQSLVSQRARWINGVIQARNDVAHGNQDRAPASAVLAMTEMLAELVELSLLLEAGVGSLAIATRLRKSPRFEWLIELHDRYVTNAVKRRKRTSTPSP